MTTAWFVSTLLGTLGWCAASAMLGLWLGERGRRLAAERLVTFGSPLAPKRAPAVSQPPAPTAEDRLLAESHAVSEETKDRMFQDFRKYAIDVLGITPDEEQLRKDIELLLSGQDVLGPA